MSTETTASRADHLTIDIHEATLPPSERKEGIIFSELSRAVGKVFADYGLDFNDTEITAEPRYTEVNAICPSCGAKVNLFCVSVDAENRVHANASCCAPDCEWTGVASYRLIDLEGGHVGEFDSAVKRGDVTPFYHYY